MSNVLTNTGNWKENNVQQIILQQTVTNHLDNPTETTDNGPDPLNELEQELIGTYEVYPLTDGNNYFMPLEKL